MQPTRNPRFDEVAYRYIRSKRPNATALEIGNAIEHLRRQIAAGRLGFDEVMSRFAIESKPNRSLGFGDMARAVRDLDGGQLSKRERDFIRQMVELGFNKQPTDRQRQWLTDIFGRLQRKAAA